MGKAKVKMELMSKEKLRNTTFKKRKEGLIRKLEEFTTLCDVDACMIIYGPKQETGPVEPTIWPPNRDEVIRIGNMYKSKKKESGNKSFGLNDFFHHRKMKIENELTKLRKRNMEAKYPTPMKLIEEKYHMNVEGLRAFASFLSNKAELVRSKIEDIKRSKSSSSKNQVMDAHQPNIGVMNSQFYPRHPPVNDMHVPFYYPSIDHHQQMNHVNQMMVMMKDDHQFGGASSSNGNNFQFASFKQQIFNGPALPFYYAMPLPPPQLSFSGGRENQDAGREDIDQYHMKNHQG